KSAPAARRRPYPCAAGVAAPTFSSIASFRSDARMPDSLSDAVIDIEHVCPRCRARLALPDLQAGLPCPSCRRQLRAVQGVISCLAGDPVNEWQSFFEGRSQADDRDTTAANDYRTALQQRYMIEAFRRACGPAANEARVLDAGCGNGLFWAALSGKPNV